MPTATVSASYVVGGISFSGKVSRSGEGGINHTVPLVAGVSGQIDASGVGSLPAGHGFLASDVIDLHWDDPTDGTHKVRRGYTVDVANANDIDFDETPVPEGDALPPIGTAVIVSKQVVVNTDFEGDLVQLMAVKSDKRVMVDFRDAAGSELALKIPAGEAWSWATGQQFTNPLAADVIDELRVSNGSTDAATVYVGVGYDSAS